MFIEIGEDDVERRYFGALYKPTVLAKLPWRDEPFDCVVFICDELQRQAVCERLAAELVNTSVDWVQVAGTGAEALHDAVDVASVRAGRQRAVGEGCPMTSWHCDASSVEQMADVASTCFGGCARVLVLVIGDDSALRVAIKRVRQRLEVNTLSKH